MTMDEQAVAAFSSAHPRGDAQIGGLNDAFSGDHDAFFTSTAGTVAGSDHTSLGVSTTETSPASAYSKSVSENARSRSN
jgi:hypothetical protein